MQNQRYTTARTNFSNYNKEIMNISESIISHDKLIYILAKIIVNIDNYPSCKNLLFNGIKLIGKDDLMHGLDDLRKALEMLLKDLLHNNLSIERQSQDKIKNIILTNGWNEHVITLWPDMMEHFKKYQNSHVKHDDGARITEKDTDFATKQALLLIMFLITKKNI